MIKDILEWGKESGAVLSRDKSKYLHICRKHNCYCNIITGNIQLNSVSELKILGITFNKTLEWHSHIAYMTKEIIERFNVIKWLSSLKFNTDTIVVINVTKALIISEIGYEHACKTLLTKIRSTVNMNIRCVLYSHRSTPNNNFIIESNVLSLGNL